MSLAGRGKLEAFSGIAGAPGKSTAALGQVPGLDVRKSGCAAALGA